MAESATTPSDMYEITVPDGDDVAVDNPLKHWPFEDRATPWASTWWHTEYITDIPQEGVNFLLAQGWVITGVTYDTTRNPPIPYYSLTKEVMNTTLVLQSLLNEYTVAYNDARWANTGRYADVIDNWTALISSTEDYHDAQVEDQNANNVVFLANLTSYMDEVDGLIDDNLSNVALETTTLLDGLGATEEARIIEDFAASLSTQLNDLIDRGLYSSLLAADITARNTRDRDEQLQKLHDQLNREKVANSHQIAEHKHRGIAEKMGEFQVQLDTQYKINTDNLKMMQYFLAERNQLMVGLYGFVERRDDVGPSISDLTKIAAGLGDMGSSYMTP